MSNLLQIRVDLLLESLTKTDKKDIEKMIKKIVANGDKARQQDIQAFFDKEIKSQKFKTMLNTAIQAELDKGLKSKQAKDVTVDVVKRVMIKLYRELAYNYSPVIDRIKI
ncbi:MAG: hypothetical protein H8E12_10455 [Rhodobacteraceae bacterium]|nr:hypothetical protein [Paracoccaceae bacterium]